MKQLIMASGNALFNANNWVGIARYAIDDKIVVGGLVKVTGKQIKEQLTYTMKQLTVCVNALREELERE